MIRVENLQAGYGKLAVIDKISCNFEPGQITTIIGQSGSGKSTLLKSLNRIIEEEGGFVRGEVFLDGENIMEKPKADLRKDISIVFQDPVAFPFSIIENLNFPLEYHTKLSKKERRERATSLLKKVRLYEEVKDRLEKSGKNLSGGQKQRLAIARSLAVEPKVLLLDEPCSALDLKNTLAIEDLLVDLKEFYTIVLVTHNLSQAKRIGDRVILMDQGQIVEVGNKNKFFTEPESELARMQINIMD